MNSRECAIVQRLIADLDSTHLLYTRLAPLLTRPHLKFLVDRMAASHSAIADDLALHMESEGARRASRGAGTLAGLRTRLERWTAVTNLDIELGCLKCVARHEARVVQRLRDALDDVRCLRPTLRRELSQLERSLFRIESLIREMETPLAAAPPRRATIVPFSPHGRPRS